jgi:hypothetical protein
MVGHTGFLTTARLLRRQEQGSRPGGPIGWVPPVVASVDAEVQPVDDGPADDLLEHNAVDK